MGFIAEMKEIFRETREEFRELAEEGQELFTVGAYRMLVKGESDYKLSSEVREEAQLDADAAREAMLEARGVSGEGEELVDFSLVRVSQLTDELAAIGEAHFESLRGSVQQHYRRLGICSAEDMQCLLDYLHALRDLPEVPSFRRPEMPDSFIGHPVSLGRRISLREKAASEYAAEASSWADTLRERTEKTEDRLDLELIGAEGGQCLDEICEVLEDLGLNLNLKLNLNWENHGLRMWPRVQTDTEEKVDCDPLESREGRLLVLLSAFHALVSSAIVRASEPAAKIPRELLKEIQSIPWSDWSSDDEDEDECLEDS